MVKTFFKRSYRKKAKEGPVEIDSSKTHLMIVESPSKCKKIESFLGSHWACIASIGHIRILDGLSNISASYEPTFTMMPEKKTHIEWMRTVIAKFAAANIYLATDDDREGEAIAWHICEVFGLYVETTPRVLFHEITKPAIKAAVANPVKINMAKVRAQQERQVLDVLVGYRISPFLWKYLYRNKDNSLSAGRCQTPALRLVYENEMEAKAAVIETKYRITGLFYEKKIEFVLSKQLDTSVEVLDFLEKSKTHIHKMSVGKKRESVQQSPKPFSTSSLLQSASSALHMSPKETMALCQELYQEGHITYMRTESQEYSAVFLQEAEQYIRTEFDEEISMTASATENPHEAIRVTHIEAKTVDTDNGRAATLYKWIWRNTVASCMPPSRSYHTPIHISAPSELVYEHIIEQPISLGWKKIDATKGRSEEDANLILYMQSCRNVSYYQIRAAISIHGRHSHYTEASLIKRLEDLGIGRPSTYASILHTLLERGYVQKTDIEGIPIEKNEYTMSAGVIEEIHVNKTIGQEKDKLRIQPIGHIVSDFLNDHFAPFFAYDYTKSMEENLDKIAAGESGISICKKCDDDITACSIPNITKPEFKLCDTDEYKIVFEKYGPVLRKVLADGSYQYENTKSGLDICKMKSGEYSLEEVMHKNHDRVIGEKDGYPVMLKTGPFGRYMECNDEKISIDDSDKRGEAELLAAFLEKKEPNLIRILTPNISIKNGKYGAYIYYKTPIMKSPKFFNLNSFRESYRLCSQEKLLQWIKEKHNIE